jgi:hypothetical protein
MRSPRALFFLFLICLARPETGLSQISSNASVSGFIRDATDAVIPGVEVTATNTETGVVTTTLSNESGSYNILSLLPGTYRLSAELPGFQTQVFNEVRLGGGVAGRYNFTLEVGEIAQVIEVTASTTTLLAETSSSIGQVLPEQQVRDLPLVSTNVLDLMRTMAGVRGETLGESTTFAGVTTGMVNTVRDGLSVQEGRYASGVGSTTLLNPDMVGEFRIILAPVDAELGRGNGQVQIVTRSGTNEFHGSAVWNVRNSAMDANTWSNNRQVVDGEWSPTKADWYNRHQPTVSVGGPIVRNRTFFFALWDQQIERQRVSLRPVVLTPCARNGIFRYWEGWANGNIQQVTTQSGANPRTASVDSFGNPLRPETWPDGSPYTGELQYFSVFGPLASPPTNPDCSDAVVSGAPWDTLRTGTDPLGISERYIGLMPEPTIYDGGDGLNTAVHQHVRRLHNNGSFLQTSGANTDTDRRQINIKIDHNFNDSHKIAGSYSFEWVDGDYDAGGGDDWPNGFTSEIVRRPRVFTVNFTSLLTPTILNEFRYGYRANKHVIWAPWEVTDSAQREVPLSFLIDGGQGYPIAYSPDVVNGMNTNSLFCVTNCAQQGNITPLTSIADTLSWTRGTHSFKAGVEFRYTMTSGSETPTAPIPNAFGGAGLNPNQSFAGNPNLPGLVPANQTTANELLYFMAGSVNNANHYYFIQTPDDLSRWESYATIQRKITEPHQDEFSFFFKDDWKVTPTLTFNLGLRYEYYGVPYEGNGLTIVPKGGSPALFGVSGRGFDAWMNPDAGFDPDLVTEVEFVGPKTINEGRSIYPKDLNNWGPAVGFSWQPADDTTVRGGYQISYAGAGRLGNLSNSFFSNAGFIHLAQTQGPTDGSYFDTTDLVDAIPIEPAVLPLQPVPILKTTNDSNAFDQAWSTPYVQNFTLGVTREITPNLSLDVRYIGTRGIGTLGILNLNTPNVFYNPALFEAFDMARAGGNPEVLDQIFLGLNLNPGTRGCNPADPSAVCGPVDGVNNRGAQHMRLSSTFRDDLANGDYAGLADALNVYNGIGGGPAGAVPGIPGERGTVLRRANMGFNVPGGTPVPGGPTVPAGLFPENWITVNPQFDDARLWSNTAKSNYHSLQVQGTLRNRFGLDLQGTYVWSRALGLPTVGASNFSGLSQNPVYTDPTRRHLDYTLASSHVTHDFRAFGTFELPIGPNRPLLGNSSGILARIVEGWQTSWILNLSSGSPVNIGAAQMLYGNGVPDVVGAFSERQGDVQWDGDFGSYFEGDFGKVADPQCSAIASALGPYCDLQAVTSGGEIVLQNPAPGQVGTLGQRTMELPGNWTFDAAISKAIQVSESMRFQFRVDATNIFNHPQPNAPTLDINSGSPFGFIQSKGDQRRVFKGQVRFDF